MSEQWKMTEAKIPSLSQLLSKRHAERSVEQAEARAALQVCFWHGLGLVVWPTARRYRRHSLATGSYCGVAFQTP